MLRELKNYMSTVDVSFKKFSGYFSDRNLIFDFISKVVITLGVVLLVGGLYLMILNPGSQSSQANAAAQSVIGTLRWVPGIPFYFSDLAGIGVILIGLVFWVMGINLLLTGLGLWARHRLARFIAIIVFAFSACMQFIEFLLSGAIGAPASVVMLAGDATVAYFLFSAGRTTS